MFCIDLLMLYVLKFSTFMFSTSFLVLVMSLVSLTYWLTWKLQNTILNCWQDGSVERHELNPIQKHQNHNYHQQ